MFHHQECKGPFRTASPLILASASPRRRELLGAAGIEFRVEVSRADEPPPEPGQRALSYSAANARAKADEVAARFQGTAVLGADTVVVLGNDILGKPSDAGHAVRMLASLCGNMHSVITACCLCLPGGGRVEFSSETRVWLAEQDPGLVSAYVHCGEPMDKAGSYAVQGCGAFMVERIEGSWTNVVGLPMEKVVPVLEGHGIIEVRQGTAKD